MHVKDVSTMKNVIPLLALGLAACASSSMADELPERCESTDCFNPLRIRNFEVLDDTTLLVYVGGQDCPFRVDFIGPECDLTFLPGADLVFRPDFMRAQRQPDSIISRVCSTDSNLGIDEGPFTRAAGASDGFGNLGVGVVRGRLTPVPDPTDTDPRLSCRVRDITSLTDDEVLELYVEHRIAAPPPPFGTGQIEVPERGDEAEAGEDRDGAAADDPASEPAKKRSKRKRSN
jgi:hypothetical protein